MSHISMYMNTPECFSYTAETYIGDIVGNNPITNCPKLTDVIKKVILFIDRWDAQRLRRNEMYKLNDAISWYEEALKIVMFEYGDLSLTPKQKIAWKDTYDVFLNVQNRSTESGRAAMSELSDLGVRRRWIAPSK